MREKHQTVQYTWGSTRLQWEAAGQFIIFSVWVKINFLSHSLKLFQQMSSPSLMPMAKTIKHNKAKC
jgi:hypothetical protein